MMVNLRDARENRYQPANMHGIFEEKVPPPAYNMIWDLVKVDPNRTKKVSFHEDSEKKESGDSFQIKTDLRDREEKPMYISVKILEATIKDDILTPILSTTSTSTLREVQDILSESFEVIKGGGEYRFLDPHSTKIGIRCKGAVNVSLAKIRAYTRTTFYQNPIFTPYFPPTRTYLASPYENPEDSLEREFRELEAKIKRLQTNFEAQKKPRLARSGPTMICGVPVTNHR